MPNLFPSKPGKSGPAFTLIELLIVVAIIAILAAIAVPNFLEAQVRAKVSRAKNDMRALATAIESYVVDYNVPPERHNSALSVRPEVPQAATRLKEMSVITTPVAYITSLPIDPFESILPPPNNIIDYYDPTQTMWLVNRIFPVNSPRRITVEQAFYILVCIGPDGYLGPINLSYGWPMDQAQDMRGSIFFIYDPTNGTISKGNLYSSGSHGIDGTTRFLMEHLTR